MRTAHDIMHLHTTCNRHIDRRWHSQLTVQSVVAAPCAAGTWICSGLKLYGSKTTCT